MSTALIYPLLIALVGFVLLVLSSNRFVLATSALSKNVGVTPLVAGVILVGFGTSFPEIIVSLIASLRHESMIAVGNAVGSNIANIGMVAGVVACLIPLKIQSRILKQEIPVLLGVTVLLGLILLLGDLSRMVGIILLLLLGAYFLWMLRQAKSGRQDVLEVEYEQHEQVSLSNRKAIIYWVLSLGVMLLAADCIVRGATQIAQSLGVSSLTIGLTVVAIGTSLPELGATLTCAIKREHDIAIGSIIGSNIFNVLAVLTVPALVAPTVLPRRLLWQDFLVMFILTVMFSVLPFTGRKRGVLGRFSGFLLLLGFVVYLLMQLR